MPTDLGWITVGFPPEGPSVTTVCDDFMASVSPGDWGKVLTRSRVSSRHLLKGESDLGGTQGGSDVSV